MCSAPSFQGHRDGLTALAFGGRKNELFTAAKDRTVKVWNLDEMAYVETLFGHADIISDIDSLSPERAVSVGVDRTVRLWKVLEETQLVFHGHTASIDCVRMLTPNSFLTGSQDGERLHRNLQRAGAPLPWQPPLTKAPAPPALTFTHLLFPHTRNRRRSSGALSLWLVTRKKPVATVHCAHGASTPAGEGSAADGGSCNWISALCAVRNSDLALSGSADGFLRFWRCDAQENALEQVHSVAVPGESPECYGSNALSTPRTRAPRHDRARLVD